MGYLSIKQGFWIMYYLVAAKCSTVIFHTKILRAEFHGELPVFRDFTPLRFDPA